MPLKKPRKNASMKTKRAAASQNIAAELKAGKKRSQAIAIGLSVAGLSKKSKKGKGKKSK